MRLIKLIKPSENDVFYDLGCGYGSPCIWIAPIVRRAIGIEDHYFRFLRARQEVKNAELHNVTIKWSDITKVSYRDATILYSVISIGFEVLRKIQKQTKKQALIVLYGLPPFPVKSTRLTGNFYQMTTPFERVKDENEFARIHLRRKDATMKELLRSIDAEQREDLKREIKQAESNWKSLTK